MFGFASSLFAAVGEPSGSFILLQESTGLKVRVTAGERTVEVSADGSVSIRKGAKTTRVERLADGSVRVEVTSGGTVKIDTYASEEALQKADAALHRELANAPIKGHGEATPADPAKDAGIGDGNLRRDGGEVREFLDELDALNDLAFGEGDLTDAERARLAERARIKLEKDMQKLQEREKDNARDDRPEESLEVRKDRYRASLKALERDLIYRVSDLRRPGGDKYESTLDDLDDRIRDTFADLHDQVDDGMPKAWPQVLEDARKFHKDFSEQLDKWGKEIGVTANVMDIPRRITEMKKQLRARLVRIRKYGGNPIESQMDALEEKILASYENLEDKVRDTPPAAWSDLMGSAEKFFVQYTAELNKWAKEAGFEEAMPSPMETIEGLLQDLIERVAQLRRLGGEKYESNLDEIEDNIKDTFANLRERVLNTDKKHWADVQKEAERHYKLFTDSISVLQRRIELGAENGRSPDSNVELPPGQHMDVIEGVRVSRLMPLPRKQLGLEYGLSVNEIVSADKVLATAGCEVYDIILEVDGKRMDSRTDLRNAVNAVEKGKEFTVKILRNGEKKELKGKR
jgi:hypothetical protein